MAGCGVRNDAVGIADLAACQGFGVYVVVAQDGRPDRRMVKIGLTSNMAKRMRQLRVHCPHRLVLLHWQPCEDRSDARCLESLAHGYWQVARFRAFGEWFDMPRGGIADLPGILDWLSRPDTSDQYPFQSGTQFVVSA